MKNRFLFIASAAGLAALCYYYFGTPTITSMKGDLPASTSPAQAQSAEQQQTGSAASSAPSTAPISRQECAALYENNQTEDNLQRNRKYALTRFFRALDAKKMDPNQQEIIGDMAGLLRRDVALSRSGFNQSAFMENQGKIVLLADDYENKAEFPSLARNMLDKAVEDKNYHDIVNAIQNKSLQPNNLRFGNSLLGHVIESNPAISTGDLQALIDAGATINLDALVYAVEQNAPTATVTFLADNYQADLSNDWQEDATHINLTLAAAKSLRPDLMQYFLNKGVKPLTVSYDNSVNTLLDVLPAPTTAQEQTRALELANIALKNGVKPYKPSSLTRLNSWLPEDVKQQYGQSLTSLMEPSNEMKALAKDLSNTIAEYDKKIALAQSAQPRCKAQHDYTYETFIENLIKQKPNTKNLPLDTKLALSSHVEHQTKELFTNPLKFIKALGVKFFPQEKALPKEFYTDLNAATMDKQWQKALELCDQSYAAIGNKEAYNLLLLQYLWSENADGKYIDTLLERGAQVLDFNVTALASRGRVDLIEKLKPHGLNLNTNTNENPLYAAIRGQRNERMVEYLIEQGVSLKPKTYGLDPLDSALQEMDTFSNMKTEDNKPYFSTPIYIALLLKAGAPVERSHREKLDMLREVNPVAYAALKNQIPDLEQYLTP